jgi:hypothetical protein
MGCDSFDPDEIRAYLEEFSRSCRVRYRIAALRGLGQWPPEPQDHPPLNPTVEATIRAILDAADWGADR